MLRFAVLLVCAVAVCQGLPSSRVSPKLRPLKRVHNEADEKIVGGQDAAQGEIPFQVSWQESGTHFCGGAIYTFHSVITSAACCQAASANSVLVAGELDLSFASGAEQTGSIGTMVIHPDFNAFTQENDICLVHLANEYFFDENVQAATFPGQGTEYLEGAIFRVSGWGTLSDGGSYPDVLQYVDVPHVTDASCEQSYGPSSITPSMICAGEKGKDSCQGDIGGPLFRYGDELVGIVSWGHSCAEIDYPKVYTQVSYFIDWIESN